MLAELGFGLDLSSCAATGDEDDLGYVSPKSGRAVSRGAGEPWQDRLLRLPAFVMEQPDPAAPSADDVADGFALTGFFLARHVLEPRGLSLRGCARRLRRRGARPRAVRQPPSGGCCSTRCCRTRASCTCARTGRLAGPTTQSGVYGVYCLVARRSVACRIRHAGQEKTDSRENRHKDAFHGTHSKVQFCLLDLTGYRINQKVPHRTRRCKHANGGSAVGRTAVKSIT